MLNPTNSHIKATTDSSVQPGPIFIVGVPRSGTTLLRLLLNAHSKVAIGPETHFFKQVWELRDYFGDLSQFDNLLKLWNGYSSEKSFEDFRFEDIEAVREQIFKSSSSYTDFLRDLLVAYANREQKIIWGEKTPEHLFNVKEILEWYPTAKIIHVVRDSRAVCSSLTKVPWSSDDLISNARVWNRYLEYAIKLKQQKHLKPAMLEVLYEDLVADTDGTLNRICEFVGIDFEPEMLAFHEQAGFYVEKNEPWKNNASSPLNKSGISKWKQELSEIQCRELEAVTREFMVRYGYLPKENITYSVSFYFTLFRAKFKWAARRLKFYTTRRLFNNP